MPPTITKQSASATLPPYPSKLVDYLTLSDFQFYERVGAAMKLSDIKQIEAAIQSLEPDPIDARNLFQKIEHEDAEARPPTPPPQLPLYPSQSVDYMTLTDEQLAERACYALRTDDMNMARLGIKALDAQTCARTFLQDIEHNYATSLLNAANTKQIGRKPRPGEDVIYADLKDDMTIRLYRGDMERDHMFCFDFVYTHDRSRHKRRPENIFLLSRGPYVGEIKSLEQGLEAVSRSIGGLFKFPAVQHLHDPEWETFVVPEGTIMDIAQGLDFRTTIQVEHEIQLWYIADMAFTYCFKCNYYPKEKSLLHFEFLVDYCQVRTSARSIIMRTVLPTRMQTKQRGTKNTPGITGNETPDGIENTSGDIPKNIARLESHIVRNIRYTKGVQNLSEVNAMRKPARLDNVSIWQTRRLRRKNVQIWDFDTGLLISVVPVAGDIRDRKGGRKSRFWMLTLVSQSCPLLILLDLATQGLSGEKRHPRPLMSKYAQAWDDASGRVASRGPIPPDSPLASSTTLPTPEPSTVRREAALTSTSSPVNSSNKGAGNALGPARMTPPVAELTSIPEVA
ncbi:hypothetical protein BDQ17DRAFT_1412445 [Cyathus striatus]|nr:hypothetical protein BDQ17DRAFT_1412445 [Cyathus striatus]